MTRKLALLLAACLGLWHGSAWALGLGEIEVRSALNERFSATIELRRIEALSQNEIIASLASAEDFSRLGVQRFFYLSELEFTTDLSDRGRPRIRVSSNRPINEPFVNFVVDVRWPTGRMLREYTVLLDPPSFAGSPTPAVRPAETPAAPRPQPAQPTTVRTEPRQAPASGRFDGDTYGVTNRNDTLWAIALQVRPSTNVSVQQTMLALQRVNPDAFIGGNINLLKAGYVLQVPSASEIARLSRQDAVVQVAEHNARWREGTPAMPVDARPAVAVGEQPARPSGELRLVAGEDDEVRATREAAPASTGAGAEALRSDLAALESRLSEAEAERSAAERQRQEAVRELEELNRQLELRNQELARLQRQLAEQQAATPARPPAASPLGMDWTLLAAGLAGLILLLVAVLMLLRRRRSLASEGPAAMAEADTSGKPIQQTQLMSAISKEDLARAGVVAGAAAGAAAGAGGDDESDVIAEADVYMAYGRFSEAARVLNSAIEADGQRADLRLKLMEVLVETQDVDAFNAQAEALRGFADEQTIELADDLASRLPGAVTSTGATSQGESAGPARAVDEGTVNLDFDLGDDFGEPADLDSLDIDFDASSKLKTAAAPALAADTDKDKDEKDEDDLTLVLDGDDVSGSEAAAEAQDGTLDLDLDFDALAAYADPDDENEELDLKFDLDEDDSELGETLAHGEPAVRDGSVESAGGEDFDFDLPVEDATADRAPQDGDENELSGFDEGEVSVGDPEFDLTLDGNSFVERPKVASPEATDAESEFDRTIARPDSFERPKTDSRANDSLIDPDFDLSLDGTTPVEKPEVAPQAEGSGIDPEFDLTMDGTGFVEKPKVEPRTDADDDGDLDLDFDIDDLPAEAGGADAKAEEDEFSSTLARDSGEEGDFSATLARDSGEEGDFSATLARDSGEEGDFSATLARDSGEEGDFSATLARDSGEDDDFFATLGRDSGEADEDMTELRPAKVEAEGQAAEDATEFPLEGSEDDESGLVAPATPPAAELPVDLADEDDLEFGMDFDEAGDETTTKLELARAYIDMGDEDGAKEILDEVVRDGSDAQQQEAAELLARLG
ncbi:MAG: hypothetical protein JJT88_07155 [Gammaproteobacteria bacterium]|nr:hypothetical protein [Gammaproteobacteria bacterium]